MNYKIISTGSQGNAVVLNGDILIDCGVSFKALQKVCKKLVLVLITHEHSDHFNPTTLRMLSEYRPTMRFGCGIWMRDKLIEAGVREKQIDVYRKGMKYDYKRFEVSPVCLYHDVPNFGYRVYYGREKVFYATDTSTLEGINAKEYDLYMIEANYTEDELKKRIDEKKAAGKYVYEYRKAKAHLSREQANKWIANNMGDNSDFVYLHGKIS
ncbi:MAG: MBL fold metallo-hydrolase [bacterium]|nr:MBL fold metallo-hydrolase [bacterium]